MNENESQFHYENDQMTDDHPVPGKTSPLIRASFALAIISVVSCMVFYVSIPCAALSIAFALLSRGSHPLASKARTALITAVIGCTISTVLTGSAVYLMFTNPEVRKQADQLIEYYYRQENGGLSEYFLDQSTSRADDDNAPSLSDKPTAADNPSAGNNAQEPEQSQQKVQLHIAP